MQFALLSLTGMICGVLLYQLPFRLFYRQAVWMGEAEFVTAYPRKRWVTRAQYVLWPLGFALVVPLMAT